jgi:glycosyltransferase involved in cell wall biosynthesis
VRGGIPTISWIPDLQHRNLPHLASRREHLVRDFLFREIVRESDVVLTSSEAARQDLQEAYGVDMAKVRVLRFVSQPRFARDQMLSLEALRAKFAIPAQYVHLPNQLWKHKNHELVIEALRHAPDVVVVATGPREDYRHGGLYDELMAKVNRYGIGERFRHLGLVSFAELISLMHHAVAVVNPSRFEGWSTTVEEAKSLGKRVLVSDIAVHREQDPPRSLFFGVDDPHGLAAALTEVWRTHDAAADAAAATAAAAALPGRTREFAMRYEQIVSDVLRGKR